MRAPTLLCPLHSHAHPLHPVQVWSKPLANGDVAAVALNRSPSPLPVNITWAMLGLTPSQPVLLRDLWAHADLGKFAGVYTAVVPSHDVLMLRATPLR